MNRLGSVVVTCVLLVSRAVRIPLPNSTARESCSAFQDKEICREQNCVWDDGSGNCTLGWDVIGVEGPHITDINQGQLGTCYFLAAVAAVAYAHPEVIEHMFVRRDLWQGSNPVYTTEWLLNGKPTRVAVDNQVPANVSGDLFFEWPSWSWDFWPVLVEKSWAKIHGNFKAIESGYGGEIFKAITQAPVDIIFHTKHLSYEDLWLWLTWAARNNYPMTSNSVKARYGMVAGHVWAVLNATVMQVNGTEERVVRLYNPWGYNKYQGRVPNPDRNQGFFFMTLDEYLSMFDHTAIARIQKGYVTSYMSVPVATGGGSPALSFEFQFTMLEDKPFAVQFAWPTARLVSYVGECAPLNPEARMQVKRLGEANTVNVKNDDEHRKSREMSNLRVDMPGGSGTYHVKVDAEFPRGAWLQEVVVNVYAWEEVQIMLKHSVTTRTEYRIDAYDGEAYTHAEFQKEYGEHDGTIEWENAKPASFLPELRIDNETGEAFTKEEFVEWYGGSLKWEKAPVVPQKPEICASLVQRLDQLDNGEDIGSRGHDSLFPAALSSIASPETDCGDAAQGIDMPCSVYNRWKRIPEIMGLQFPPIKH